MVDDVMRGIVGGSAALVDLDSLDRALASLLAGAPPRAADAAAGTGTARDVEGYGEEVGRQAGPAGLGAPAGSPARGKRRRSDTGSPPLDLPSRPAQP